MTSLQALGVEALGAMPREVPRWNVSWLIVWTAGFSLNAFAIEPASRDAKLLVAQAIAHEHGEGVPTDRIRAAQLYCRAAKMGDADGQFGLGWMYANGRGVLRDDGIAATLFDKAARQGHVDAQRMLRFVGEPSNILPNCMKADVVVVQRVEPGEEHPPERRKIVELVNRLAPEYKISPALALAVIEVESNFNAQARSSKNAQGLMQLIPETAERFNVRDPFDPVQNIRGGLAYLRWLLCYFRGNVALVAAGYNAGEGAVDRYGGIPPFRETRGYVKRILDHFKREVHPYDESVTEPSPQLRRLGVRSRIPRPG